MNLDLLLVMFQIVVLLLSLSVHECVHAYAAMRLGDATAYMTGRVTLNPARHIDTWGTIVMPALSFFMGGMLVGWAKPVPITLRNFRKMKRDDILSTVAGLASFLGMALLAMIGLIILKHMRGVGADAVLAAQVMPNPAFRSYIDTQKLPTLFPIALMLYYGVLVNVMLFVFNLIPVPPLDMSRVIRYYLPYNVEKAYDRMGMIGSFLMFFVAWRILFPLFYPPLIGFFDSTLTRM